MNYIRILIKNIIDIVNFIIKSNIRMIKRYDKIYKLGTRFKLYIIKKIKILSQKKVERRNEGRD